MNILQRLELFLSSCKKNNYSVSTIQELDTNLVTDLAKQRIVVCSILSLRLNSVIYHRNREQNERVKLQRSLSTDSEQYSPYQDKKYKNINIHEENIIYDKKRNDDGLFQQNEKKRKKRRIINTNGNNNQENYSNSNINSYSNLQSVHAKSHNTYRNDSNNEKDQYYHRNDDDKSANAYHHHTIPKKLILNDSSNSSTVHQNFNVNTSGTQLSHLQYIQQRLMGLQQEEQQQQKQQQQFNNPLPSQQSSTQKQAIENKSQSIQSKQRNPIVDRKGVYFLN
jgi:hypothetical protein